MVLHGTSELPDYMINGPRIYEDSVVNNLHSQNERVLNAKHC